MQSMLGVDLEVKLSFNSSDSALQVNQLPISIDFPRESDRFYEELTLLMKRIINSLNTKEGSLYTLIEQFNFNQYFINGDPNNFRNVYRKVFDMVQLNGGPIGPGVTVSKPHNIPLPFPTNLFNGSHIFGSATNSDVAPNGPKRMPLPYASEIDGKNIEIFLDDVNVVIINGSTQTTLTYATIVAEYLKN